MPSKPIAAIEIGTTRTVAMLGTCSPKADGSVDITAVCTEKTAGIRKCEVQSAQSVTTTAEGVILALSKKGRTDINRINLVYSGGDLQGMSIFGKTHIDNASDVVEEDDVDTAIENMRNTPALSGRTTLEEMKVNLVLDAGRIVEDPVNLKADELTVNGLRTHVDTNSYRALTDAVESANCDIDNVFSAAASAPLGCTRKEQRMNGVLVIDLGGGSTSWSVTHKDRITYVGHLAIGGDHITNDILCAFHTGTDESATALKHDHAKATLDGVDPAARVDLPKNMGMSKTINLRALDMVVNARIDETLRILYAEAREAGALDGLGAGIVLCGGGALLKGITQLVTQIFDGIPCSIGSLPTLKCKEIDDDPEKIRYATVYGALLRAAKIETEEDEVGGGNRFFNFFGRSGGRK